MSEFRRHLPSDNSLASMHLALGRLWDALEATGSAGSTASSRVGTVAGVSATAIPTPSASGTVTLHNVLPGLQGGDVDNYYHLTLTDWTGTGTGVVVRQTSPVLAGSPTVPTATLGDNTLKIINSAFLNLWTGSASLTTLGTIATGVWAGTSVAAVHGGTGLSAYVLGDTVYASAANTLSQLAGNTSATMAVLTQTGTGTVSAAPAWTSTTGTGNVVRATSPTLVTPALGVATATSINKVAITAPATSATITIADGKTFTASNTVTLSGTDGSTLNMGTGGTLGTAAFTAATAYEPALGNPGTSGFVLSSTTLGVRSWIAAPGTGTVTSVAALTLGTTGTDLSSTVATGTTTPVITLQVPTASAANRGALSAADWTTFNGKQAALGFTPINKAGDSGIGALSMGALTATSGNLSGTITSTVSGSAAAGMFINYGSSASFGILFRTLEGSTTTNQITAFGSTSGLGGRSNTLEINPIASDLTVATGTGPTERFRISNSGAASFNGNAVSMGALTATTAITSNYAVASLPAGSIGMRAFANNALAPTFGAAVVGGGAVVVPVFHDGVSWKVG